VVPVLALVWAFMGQWFAGVVGSWVNACRRR
jgi:hypothetical protein